VCKEYRGACIGMRFLHPVWFIDEVELSDCDYTRRASAARAEKLLKQLFFQPFFYDGCYRRRLTLQEIATYQSRQRLRAPEPINMLGFRGVRSKSKSRDLSHSPGGISSPEASGSPASSHADASPAQPKPPEPPRAPEDAEPCAVCLEAPRCALLVPCGHMAMCVECAEKVLHSSRAACVVCRQPIEKVLRAAPPV